MVSIAEASSSVIFSGFRRMCFYCILRTKSVDEGEILLYIRRKTSRQLFTSGMNGFDPAEGFPLASVSVLHAIQGLGPCKFHSDRLFLAVWLAQK